MAFKVRYNPQIYLDISKAVKYYHQETGSDELGNRFVKTVKLALQDLKYKALHYQIRYDNIRFLIIPSFPFIAHYRVDKEANTVYVEAVFHESEDPDKWYKRI